MLPIIIVAAVAVPLLVIAFVANRRKTERGEHPEQEDPAARAAEQEEYEDEFEKAEAYQAEWREEQHKTEPEDKFY